jgi:hypothetical protein
VTNKGVVEAVGTAYKVIRQLYSAGDGRIKKKLHEIASALFNVPLDLWEQREGKETPHPALLVSKDALTQLASVVKVKLHDVPRANVRAMLSPRQALIYVSEVICKPAFGADYFGRERAERVASPGLWVCESGGFVEEVQMLPPEDVCIIRIYGRGRFNPEDTRSYIDLPGAFCVEIQNVGTERDFLRAVTATVDDFLHYQNSRGVTV